MEALFAVIIILLLAGGFQRYSLIKENEEVNNRLADLDLNEKTSLRFPKHEYYWDKRYVEFYNPVVRQWWYLPKEDVKTPKLWSFKKYGASNKYNLHHIYQVEEQHIENARKKFRTLGDIQEHFERCNDRYYQRVNKQERSNELKTLT